MRLERDERKNILNQRKHGVSFEEAGKVFLDPLHVSVLERVDGGEERWQTFGLVDRALLLMVAHTIREESLEEVVRIISARAVIPQERRRYEDEMVSYTLETLPPLTEAQRVNLKRLAVRPASEIDTSDAPVLTDEQWASAPRRNLYRPLKRQITARVDADVLDWLQAQGKGYQSRINAILRREMLEAAKR